MRVLIFFILTFLLNFGFAQENYLTLDFRIPKGKKAKFNEIKAKIIKPNYPELEKKEKEEEEALILVKPNKIEKSISKLDLAMNNIMAEAKSYLGTRYRYGGTTRSGIDCSAFMQKIYSVEGIELPRVSYHQAKTGTPVSRGELQKGDLIFFSTTSRYRITHVGMITDVTKDDITFIHAASSKGVSYASLNHPYWNSRYRGARRPNKLSDLTEEPLISDKKELTSTDSKETKTGNS